MLGFILNVVTITDLSQHLIISTIVSVPVNSISDELIESVAAFVKGKLKTSESGSMLKQFMVHSFMFSDCNVVELAI